MKIVVKLADQFISLANKRNKKFKATELQLLCNMLARDMLRTLQKMSLMDNHEEFVDHMTAQFKDMMRSI